MFISDEYHPCFQHLEFTVIHFTVISDRPLSKSGAIQDNETLVVVCTLQHFRLKGNAKNIQCQLQSAFSANRYAKIRIGLPVKNPASAVMERQQFDIWWEDSICESSALGPG